MNPLETYIQELYDIRSTGAATPETAYYPALSNLLNEVGKTLKPKVKCIISLKNRGAGLPDGGLFTPDQFQKGATEPIPTIAARGVIEVKPTSKDAWFTADGEQVSRYWGKYRQVLVTNLRDFLLVGQDAEGNQVKLEAYRLALGEKEFWKEAAHPRRLAAAHGERFIEYLKRVMLQAAPLAAPKEVAWFLASYARDAKARIEGVALPALDTLRNALEEALGLKFEGTKADPDKGEHFFRSTLVQTIFYGVFSAWVLWSKKHPPTDLKARFHWREAAWHLHVPMIKALFEQLSMPSKLEPLGLVEVLDWTETCLNRVSRADFFAQFEEVHAVQYFYEPFLEAFDPKLRKDLGVWYTPPEIVQYMVARVDAVLRQELDIPDGLADPRVYVLDPCCGTGAYLVEVSKSIHATLQAQGGNGLMAHKVKLAALSRVFGFEIMPAPFVVAHLQLGLYLQNLGAPLAEETTAKKGERAGIYLTNALTGWEPPTGPKKQLIFPEMQEERDAAEDVKRDKPILVILGNPPYNAFAGVSAAAEKILVEPYKEGLVKKWGIKKFNLDDLYIRFFGLAERRIAGMTGKGVVSFISNFSYLGDPSFLVMRQRFLAEFDALWFDCLNGD
ncbi:MAG: DNA methyltransferase, partial [Deltaproteobacteria bacterium]|nr:DNA methyltransferase [Deltaproteobacteria bacterium]